MSSLESEFPYSLYVSDVHESTPQLPCEPAKNLVSSFGSRFLDRTISLPLPDNRLADSALRALEVDAELSPFVKRSLTLVTATTDSPLESPKQEQSEAAQTVLKVAYRATTNRMLRVAVNGFMESLGVVLGVMQELDVDSLREEMGK